MELLPVLASVVRAPNRKDGAKRTSRLVEGVDWRGRADLEVTGKVLLRRGRDELVVLPRLLGEGLDEGELDEAAKCARHDLPHSRDRRRDQAVSPLREVLERATPVRRLRDELVEPLRRLRKWHDAEVDVEGNGGDEDGRLDDARRSSSVPNDVGRGGVSVDEVDEELVELARSGESSVVTAVPRSCDEMISLEVRPHGLAVVRPFRLARHCVLVVVVVHVSCPRDGLGSLDRRTPGRCRLEEGGHLGAVESDRREVEDVPSSFFRLHDGVTTSVAVDETIDGLLTNATIHGEDGARRVARLEELKDELVEPRSEVDDPARVLEVGEDVLLPLDRREVGSRGGGRLLGTRDFGGRGGRVLASRGRRRSVDLNRGVVLLVIDRLSRGWGFGGARCRSFDLGDVLLHGRILRRRLGSLLCDGLLDGRCRRSSPRPLRWGTSIQLDVPSES